MLFLCIFLNFSPFVFSDTGLPITYACKNSKATIYFKTYEDINSVVKYTKLLNTGKTELVASILKGKIKEYTRDISVDNDGNLRIEKVSEKHEGVYKREIRNGGTIKETAILKVFKPPSGPAKILKRKVKAGKDNVYCVDPNDLGIPRADVVLQDTAGNTQSQYDHTINDDAYKCCLVGESVTRCYPNHLDKCTVLRLNETRRKPCLYYVYNSTKRTAKECQQTGLCVLKSIISFTLCYFVFFFAFINISAKGNNWKERLIDIGKCRLAAGPVLPIIILLFLCGHVCSRAGCEDFVINLMMGVASSFFGMFTFIRFNRDGGIRNRRTPDEETTKKENGENVNQTNSLIPNEEKQGKYEEQDDTGRDDRDYSDKTSRNSSISSTRSTSTKTSNKSGTANCQNPINSRFSESQ